MDNTITAQEAAEILGCSSSWVRKACERGRIKGASKHGPAWKIPRASLKGLKVQEGPGNPQWKGAGEWTGRGKRKRKK